jgi:hypothetical protein
LSSNHAKRGVLCYFCQSTSQPQVVSAANLFAAIYNEAVRNYRGLFGFGSSKAELSQLKTAHGTLDIEYDNETPAIRLAREGKYEALTLLLKVGIDTDQLLSCLTKSGNLAAVNLILSTITNVHDQIVNINALIRKCAGENNQIAVETLLAYGANINWAARGFAENGYAKEAEALQDSGASLRWIVRGLARSGNNKKVNKYLGDVKNDKDQYDTLLVWATHGYAEGGYKEDVDKILRESCGIDGHPDDAKDDLEPDNQLYNYLIISATMGYAEGGHEQEVNAMIDIGRNNDRLSAAAQQGFALGKHSDDAAYHYPGKEDLNIKYHQLGRVQAGFLSENFKSMLENEKQRTRISEETMEIIKPLAADIEIINAMIKVVAKAGHYNLLEYIEGFGVLDTEEAQWHVAKILAESGHIIESAKWMGTHKLKLNDKLTPQHKASLKRPTAVLALLVFSLENQPNDAIKEATVSSFIAHDLLSKEDNKEVKYIVSECAQISQTMQSNHLSVEQASVHDVAIFLAVANDFSEINTDIQNLIASYLRCGLLIEDQEENINNQRQRLIARGKTFSPHFVFPIAGDKEESSCAGKEVETPLAAPAAG